jgi:hypothetical protein
VAKIAPDEPCPCGSGKPYKDCHQATSQITPVVSEHVPLTVIPEPDPGTRSVFMKLGEGTILFSGRDSQISFDCGQCHAPLIVGLSPGTVSGVVIQCAGCGAFNDTLPIPPQSNKEGIEAKQLSDRVVHLSQLAGEKGLLDGITFIGCDIKGPAVLVLQACTLSNCNLGGPSPDAVLWEVPATRSVIVGAILAARCVFEKCTFMNIGIAGPPELIRQIRDSMPGVQ